MTETLIDRERQHLAQLIEAIQRCAYFLDAANASLVWPLQPDALSRHRKDTAMFGALAAFNERFAKLQDTLGAAMRHSMGLSSEPADTFLKVLSFYEKIGVLESITAWQTCRSARNLAAHSYETDYSAIAEHFNTLHDMRPTLHQVAGKFVAYCQSTLDVGPSSTDFAAEFQAIVDQPR